jgi:simple sugar transport system permease protein
MGVGGAFLTLAAFNSFYFQMVNGARWICVALVVFAQLAPGQGAARRAAVRVLRRDAAAAAAGRRGAVPYQAWLMLPYVLSIVALVAVARRASYPQALMKPYRKGER